MALKGSQFIIIIYFFMSSLFAATTAQSSSLCQSALVSLSPCLNFISGEVTTPSSSCCKQLGPVVKSEPQCLCSVLSGDAASGLGISINKTQALELPAACRIQTSVVSQCNISSSPPSTGSPSTPSSPSGGGSINNPSVDTASAKGSAAQISVTLVLSLMPLALLSSASTISI